MVSQADREKARRLQIERAYVQPEPRHDWADAAPSDRPSVTVDRIVAAAVAKGWVVEEKTRLDWHPPKWVTRDQGPADYVAAPRVQYSLFVHHPLQNDAPDGKLAGLTVNFVDGTKSGSVDLGYGGAPLWRPQVLSITGLAKLIAEEGAPA